MAWKFFTKDGSEKIVGTGNASDRGTSLPASPYDGQEFSLVVDATNGIVWRCKYNAGSASSFKWEFIGGSPLSANIDTLESTSSNTYTDLATVGPSITIPRNGDYLVEINALISLYTSQFNMSYAVGATAPQDSDGLVMVSGSGMTTGGFATGGKRRLKPGLTAGTAIVCKYHTSAGTALSVGYRNLIITPVRIS